MEVNMKKLVLSAVVIVLVVFALGAGFTSRASAAPNSNACWGQASKVFAQTGAMGEHSSSFDSPRLGLRNLARALYEQGVLPDDSMAALGAFVATELGYSIDACLTP
jgi:hypothetical protein